MNSIYYPILIMLASIILIIISMFLLFYYNVPLYAFIFFMMGILLGLIACLVFIYQRTPGNIQLIDT